MKSPCLSGSLVLNEGCSRLLLLIVIALAGFGCINGDPWRNPGPRATFEEFLLFQMKGERALAFDLISPEDRTVLETDRSDVTARIGVGLLTEPWQSLWIRRVDTPFQLSKIEQPETFDVQPKDGQRVTMRLLYRDGAEGEATMVWRAPRWYVHLGLDT